MEAGLPIVAPLWENIQVKRSIHLCRLLALFLIVGLGFAPLSAPANAATTASMAAASMSDDMPCCPEKSAPVDCGDKCLLMAICMAKTFQALPSAGVIDVQPVAVRKLSPRSDPEAESRLIRHLQDLLSPWSVRLNAGRLARFDAPATRAAFAADQT